MLAVEIPIYNQISQTPVAFVAISTQFVMENMCPQVRCALQAALGGYKDNEAPGTANNTVNTTINATINTASNTTTNNTVAAATNDAKNDGGGDGNKGVDKGRNTMKSAPNKKSSSYETKEVEEEEEDGERELFIILDPTSLDRPARRSQGATLNAAGSVSPSAILGDK